MSTTKRGEQIEVDVERGHVFDDEEQLFAYFEPRIQALEKLYARVRKGDDYTDDELDELSEYLEMTLEDPDEVYESFEFGLDEPLGTFIRTVEVAEGTFYYIAICYLAKNDEPTFVYLHFATRFREFVDHYKKGDLVYTRSFRDTEVLSLEGDALSDGDELAIGLSESMLKIRGDKDIPISQFHEYADLRESTIEEADEIWRNTDLSGNTLVSFIRSYEIEGEEIPATYIVITVEDTEAKVHSLLFSFPTKDESLVDRYRHGENLQAEGVSQESSH